MARILDATVPEVHRNFTRLVKVGLIAKNTDGAYRLTEYGKVVFFQVPTIAFMSKNKTYFKGHSFGDLPPKFIQRIGSLSNSKIINGYVKVSEKWNDIYKNAEKFIHNILVEVSYEPELMKILQEKMEKKIAINSIFSDNAIITKGRKKSIKENDLKRFVEDGVLVRKMKKEITVALILNEKEAGICFPTSEETDLSKMFHSSDPEFHEFCMDYFEHCWQRSGRFQEDKLRE
jgi:predicted transcriptional regulator